MRIFLTILFLLFAAPAFADEAVCNITIDEQKMVEEPCTIKNNDEKKTVTIYVESNGALLLIKEGRLWWNGPPPYEQLLNVVDTVVGQVQDPGSCYFSYRVKLCFYYVD